MQATKGVDFDGLIKALKEAPPKSVVVLHACAHNPTGAYVHPNRRWRDAQSPSCLALNPLFIINRAAVSLCKETPWNSGGTSAAAAAVVVVVVAAVAAAVTAAVLFFFCLSTSAASLVCRALSDVSFLFPLFVHACVLIYPAQGCLYIVHLCPEP